MSTFSPLAGRKWREAPDEGRHGPPPFGVAPHPCPLYGVRIVKWFVAKAREVVPRVGGLSLDVAQRRSKRLAKRALHCAVASERLAAGPPRRWDGASLRLGGQPPYNLISGRRFGRSIILRAQVARPGMDRTNLSLGVLTPGPGAVTGPIPDEANGLRTAARFSVGSGALQDRPLGNEAGLEVAPQRNGQFARHGDDGDAPDAPLLVADAPAEPLGERAVGLVMQP